MTKDYHLTPEQALKLFDEAGGILDIDDKCPLAVSATDLANTINAALDEVLGEPVGEIVIHGTPSRYQTTTTPAFKTVSMFENWATKPIGTKLYAPKELT